MVRHVSDQRRRDAATQAARRVIASGGRPLYRLRTDQGAQWTVDWMPWPSFAATDRRAAMIEARAATAAWLEVDPQGFDVEA